MSARAVQTSAQAEPDMFGHPEEPAANDQASAVLIAFTGRLVANADVRSKPSDSVGHMCPVLCMDLQESGPHRRVIHIEQPFPEARRKDAERQAASFKKGQLVTVHHGLPGMRLSLPNTVAIFHEEPSA